MQIELSKFKAMSGEFQDAQEGLHKEIIGSVSDIKSIYRSVTGIEKRSSYDGALYLAKAYSTISTGLTNEVSAIVPNSASSGTIKAWAITRDYRVYGIDDAGVTDEGIPIATAVSTANDIIVYNNNIVASNQTAGIYRATMAIPNSWSLIAGTINTAPHLMEVFAGRVYFTDTQLGLTVDRRLVRFFDSTFVAQSGLDLGSGAQALDIKNVNDRYLAVFANLNLSATLQEGFHIFIWNGSPLSRYDYSIKVKGTYMSSVLKDGILYIFHKVNAWLYCSALNGLQIQEIGRIKNVALGVSDISHHGRVSYDGDYFVIPCSLSNTTTSASGILYWNGKDSFFAYSDVAGANSYRLAFGYDNQGATTMYIAKQGIVGMRGIYRRITDFISNSQPSMSYISNLIKMPVSKKSDTLAGNFGRAKINRIDIDYSQLPPSITDTITINLFYRDVLTTDNFSSYTAILRDTTANSTNSTITPNRAIINNIGVVASEIYLTLEVSVTTLSWDLMIPKIVVDITNIELTQ